MNVVIPCVLLLIFRVVCSFLGLPMDGVEIGWLVFAAILLVAMLFFHVDGWRPAFNQNTTTWLCVGSAVALDGLTLACGTLTDGAIRHLGVITSSLWSSCLFSIAIGVRLETRIAAKEAAVLLLALAAHIFLLMLQPYAAAVLFQVITCMALTLKAPSSALRKQLWVGSIGLAALVGVFIASKPYIMRRLLALFAPYSDPLGAGFQMLQYRKAFQLAGLGGTEQALALPGSQASSTLPFLALSFGNMAVLGVLVVAIAVYATLFAWIRRIETSPIRRGLMGAWVLLALMQLFAVAFSFGLIPVAGNIGILFISSGEITCATLLLALAARSSTSRFPTEKIMAG
jgi:cell division protein FtsW (lipid II flippase)